MAGATPLGNMVIKLGLDDADFGKGVTNAKKQVTYLAKEMTANMKIADLAGNKMGKLGTQYDSLSNIIAAQKKQVTALKTAYDNSFVDGKATDSTKRLAGQLQDANGKLANYQLQLQNTAGQLARMKVENEGVTGWLNKQSQAYIQQGENIAKYGEKVSKAGTALTIGVTAPIVAGVTAVTKAASDWESAYAGVRKTNDEVVDSNGTVVYSYADLEKGLRGLTKQLPSSHSEIAAVAEAAGQLGIKTQDVVGFTKVMIDMGESTNLSAEDAATAIARIANITGLTSDEYQRFGSSIVALGNNYATTESEILEMTNRLAASGTLAGLTNQEIIALATSMSSVGIEAEAGGTAMTQTLGAIETAASKGAGAFGEIEKMANSAGLSLEDVSVAVSKGGKELKSTASAMGMTNTELKKMYNDASKASDSLGKFAEVAGMSSEQFAIKWKDKPIEAIQAFIKGLGELDKKGESATLVLDDMGLSGIRQSNMLKSLALASDTMTSAVSLSNKAWQENTALTNEATTRYETTESKIKMLKNEITDMAIDLGGPFVDALRSTLKAVKPTVEMLGQLAKQFNELDTEQQQNILKWIGIAAAAGPTLKLLGGGIKVIGNTRKGVGLLTKGIVELQAAAAEKKAISYLVKTITGVSTASTTAGGALAGGGSAVAGGTSLVAGLSAIAIPAGIAVGSIVAVNAAAYAGYKAYEAHELAGARWGTSVTKEQDKVINKTYELQEKSKDYLTQYADGVSGSAEKAIEANKKIVQSIETTIEKERERERKAAEGLYSEEAKKRAQEQIDYQKKLDQGTVESATIAVGRINTIIKNASDNKREISDAERQYINNNYTKLSAEQLNAAGITQDKILAIQTAYQEKLSNLSKSEQAKRSIELERILNKETEDYESQKEKLATIYGKNTEAYKKELDALDRDRTSKNQEMILALAKLAKEQGTPLDILSSKWEKYGWTTEQVQALVAQSTTNITKNLDMMAKGTNEAAMQWNEMALDPKTGEVKTNMADTLKEMAKTDEGWNQLKFLAKEADISTNAKEEVAVAMGEVGKWNNLYPSEQKILVNGDEAKLELFNTIEKLGQWNTFNTDRKNLGIENADAIWKLLDTEEKVKRWNEIIPEDKKLLANDTDFLMKLSNSTTTLTNWNTLPADQKQIMADNTDLMNKVFSSNENYQAWVSLPDNLKKMFGDNVDIVTKLNEGQIKLSAYDANNPALKRLLGDSVNVQIASSSGEQALNSYSANNPANKILNGNSSSVQTASSTANSALNSFSQNNPAAKALSAADHASGPASQATQSVREFSRQKDHTVTLTSIVKNVTQWITEKFSKNATGTNYHPGGLALVNDQTGPLYKEIVQLPSGKSFIPNDRNTMLDLPKGSKVIKASKTKALMQRAGIPNYEDGIGIPKDSLLVDNLMSMSNTTKQSSTSIITENKETLAKLDDLISIMNMFNQNLNHLELKLNEKVFGELVNKATTSQYNNSLGKLGRRVVR
ncbi:phage tail tape measure protein [Enterococcus sp. AZ102]|uniref:phage tail tape measure protein n=1 Tax=Enterococcus sp. AZ102 TaxID=2774865 RepID=UPI003F1EAD77